MPSSSLKSVVIAISAVAALIAVSACGSGTSPTAATSSTGPVLTDAINSGFPPFEYTSASNQFIGSDIDLAQAIAGQLHMKLVIDNTSFTSIIPGVADGRYDIAISGITDTAAREKVVNFVDYYEDGSSLLVKKGDPDHLTLGTSLCGKSVSAVTDSTQTEVVAPILQKECEAAHASPISILALPESADPTVAVLDGRAIAGLIDSADGAYVVRTSPSTFSLAAGGQLADSPIGVVVRKSDTALLDKVQSAFAKLIEDGKYKAIMVKWGLISGEVTSSKVNQGA
jgi:polar amino acid transport system substrate-binding protein